MQSEPETGVGVNSLISRKLGEKRFEEANSAASHGLRIVFLNWAIFALFGIFFTDIFVNAYSDTPFVIENATAYCRIVTIGSLFFMFQINTERTLQAEGNMILPMICNITGASIHILLAYFLVFGIGPFPQMGVPGAAIATVCGQAVAAVLGLFLLLGKRHQVKIQIRGFKFNIDTIKSIYVVGLPSIVMQSIGSVMLVCLNGILIAFSEAAVAVLGIYFRMQSFIFMPVFGLSVGSMPIMGYNYGARYKTRLMKAFKIMMITAIVIMGIGLVLFQTIPELFLQLFSATPEMYEIGVPALKTISLCFLPAAFGITCSTMFQATGHGVYSLILSLVRQLIGVLPLAWIFAQLSGLAMVWAAFPFAEILGTLASIILLRRIYIKEIKYLDQIN